MSSIILRLREPRLQRAVLLGLMGVLLAAGAAYSLRLGDTLRFGDELAYYRVANNLYHHHWFSEDGIITTAYRAPGYPFLLCALRWLHLPIAGLRFFNFVALAGSCALAFSLLRRQGFAAAGLVAAVLLAAYPVLFYTAGTLYPQTLGTFLLLLTVACATWDGDSWRGIALGGAAFGALTLCIPSMLPMLPVFALTPWVMQHPGPARRGAVFATVAALVILPWTIRNEVVFHAFIPVSTNSGYNLLLGNSEHAGPDTGDMTDISYDMAQTRGMSQPQADKFLRTEALAWVAGHKGDAARLYALKFCNYFNFHNKMDTGGVASRATDALLLLSYGPLLTLFVLRWLLARAYPPAPLERLLALVYLGNALLSAIFFTRIRFRVPFDALLICAVALFLQTALRAHLTRRDAAPRFPEKEFS